MWNMKIQYLNSHATPLNKEDNWKLGKETKVCVS